MGDMMQALAPMLVLSLGAVVLMLQVAIKRSPGWAYGIALASFVGAGGSVFWAADMTALQVTPLLLVDQYALLFSLLFCFCGAITSVIAHDYLSHREGQSEEYFLLLILSTLGALTLAHATHLASLLLGMELLGVALYALRAYPDEGTLPLEAAIKYLVLSGAASAVFMFGFALIYAATGTLGFDAIGVAVRKLDPHSGPILLAGAAMIITGLGFKLSAVPFHMWTPDVYEGAPSPTSGFLAAVSKSAIFVVVLRWWMASGLYEFDSLVAAIALLAGASMLVGNLLALRQDNVKRILAYSSIAHIGYLLIMLVAIAVSTDPALAVEASSYYLIAYAVTSLAAFTLLGLLSRNTADSVDNRDRDQLQDLKGLFWHQPGLSLLFTISLLSLAGIPLTAGFIGKFYLFTAGVDSALWGLLATLVIGSAMGIYYYLRIIFTMTQAADNTSAYKTTGLSAASRLVCYILIFVMLYLGIVPEPLMGYLRTIL
jgi:NADH-quinone oxidoreductase subunit N